MQRTPIEWCDYSSNPIYAVRKDTGKRGWACTRVSSGCQHCYAEAINKRLGTNLPYDTRSKKQVEYRLNDRELDALRKVSQPCRIFVGDMLDLFHADISDLILNRLFDALETPFKATIILLTKRPERMAHYLRKRWTYGYQPQFIWGGTSIEDQPAADVRIPMLRRVPVAVRFLSVEPLLEQVHLALDPGMEVSRGIHWVIVGGESGAQARPMHPSWARSLRDQCLSANVPVFFKQIGEWTWHDDPYVPGAETRVLFRDGSMSAYPCDYDPIDWARRGACLVRRVGKKRAGRLLDGLEWNQWP